VCGTPDDEGLVCLTRRIRWRHIRRVPHCGGATRHDLIPIAQFGTLTPPWADKLDRLGRCIPRRRLRPYQQHPFLVGEQEPHTVGGDIEDATSGHRYHMRSRRYGRYRACTVVMLGSSVSSCPHPRLCLSGGPSLSSGHDEPSASGTYALAKYGRKLLACSTDVKRARDLLARSLAPAVAGWGCR
jgi:hypothetical protein